jgi:hypothetical protein
MKTLIKVFIDLEHDSTIDFCLRLSYNRKYCPVNLQEFRFLYYLSCIILSISNGTKLFLKVSINKRRIFNTSVNVLLLLIIFTLLLSGLCNSRVLLGSLHLEGSMMLRQIHTTVAYCCCLLFHCMWALLDYIYK